MMRFRTVAFVAVKLPSRPLVEELVLPLLFGFTEATSKARLVDVGIAVGVCASTRVEAVATRTRTIRTLFMAD